MEMNIRHFLIYVVFCWFCILPDVFSGTPGTLKWVKQYESGYIPSVAISKDGTVYVTGGSSLKAVNLQNGEIIWSYDAGTSLDCGLGGGTPVILPDGNICFGGFNGTLYVVTPKGHLKWSKYFGNMPVNYPVAVTSDGRIFFVYGKVLYCMSLDGDIIWSYQASYHSADADFRSPPVIGLDGCIYVSGITSRTLYAINSDGTLKWRQIYPWAAGNPYDDPADLGTPAIGSNGHIYVGDSRGYLREIEPISGNCVQTWAGMDRSSWVYQPVILSDGRIIIGCDNARIDMCMPSYGSPVTTFFTQGAVRCSPAIGSDGTIYFGVAYQTTQHDYYFYALNPDFWTVKWQYYVGHEMKSSPAIGPDGTVYITTIDGYVYAFYAENTDYQKGSPFPKFRHDNSNTGNSIYNFFVKCQPSFYDFGNVNLSSSVYKTFSLTNVSNVSYTIGQIGFSGENFISGEFSLTEDCSNKTIAPGETINFTVKFRPLLNGKRSASIKIPFGISGSGSMDWLITCGLTGNGGGNNQSALTVVVYDGSNGKTLDGANVRINNQSNITDNQGRCIFTPINAGSYDVKVSKDGYCEITKPVEIPASSNLYCNIVIYPSNFTAIQILDIFTPYEGNNFFIDGVDFNVEFAVNIDWATFTPSMVKFITPKRVIEVPAVSNTVKQTFNMGSEFGVGGELRVQAISKEGAISEEKKANFVIMKKIPFFSFIPVASGSYFSFESSFGINFNFFNEGVDGNSIPSDIPLFGGNPVLFKFIPTISCEVKSDGSASIGLDFKGLKKEEKIESGTFAGFSFSLYPLVSIDGQYYPALKEWDLDGYIGLHGEAEFKKSWPFVVMAGPVPIPMYAKAGFTLEAEALAGVTSFDPLGLNGKLSINPYVRGSLGAGVDEMLAVEGWIGGGLDMELQFPQQPALDELSIYLNAGFNVYALLFSWENELLHWAWSLVGGKVVLKHIPELTANAKVVSRDYINHPDYGLFTGGKTIVSKLQTPYTKYSTLQENVFPYSEPAIASAGQYLYAVWLYDDPLRSSLNRTKLVFSYFDGNEWSLPVSVADDGTADFHPDIVVFEDGSAAVTWENVKVQLPDDASFGLMKQNLEICVSIYDPQTKTWSNPFVITDNNYLDRSPKIRGSDRNNLMVMWISNQNNHITGNNENPNVVYSSIWNGNQWQQPQIVFKEVINWDPYTVIDKVYKPILNYDFCYDSYVGKFFADACFSVDMDNDLTTINDREIYYCNWNNYRRDWNQNWTTRLTNDDLPDVNVHYLKIGEKYAFLWLKENMLMKYISVNNPENIYNFEDFYSTNLASFRLAKSPNGRIALLWSEPSQYSSDIFAVFYDPISSMWGKPQRLTFDPETENSPAFAFYGDELLVGLYDKVEINVIEEKVTTSTGKKINLPERKKGSTNLALLMHEIETDVTFVPGTFVITPRNPSCGNSADTYATIINTGNTVIQNIPVFFYEGNSESRGDVIYSTTVSLVPGEEKTISFEWIVPDVVSPVTLYAVIDPEETINNEIRTNNIVSIETVLPDIKAEHISTSFIKENLLFITATIQNTGVLPAEQFTVKIVRDRQDGNVLFEKAIDTLGPCEIEQINFLLNTEGMSQENLYFYLIVDSENDVREFDETNNICVFKMNPSVLKGDINEDGIVDISDVILCLRMAIGLPVVINQQIYNLPYTERLRYLADLNSEQNIDISDVILVLRKAIHLD